jgi:hypothetical protein
MALTRLNQKYLKHYFNISQNTFGRMIQNYVDSQSFHQSKALRMLNRDIIIFYTKACASNDVDNAQKALAKKDDRMPSKTNTKISVLIGANFVIAVVLAALFIIWRDDRKWLVAVSNQIQIYYLFFWLFLTVICSAICV